MMDVERVLQAIADLEATAVFLRKRAGRGASPDEWRRTRRRAVACSGRGAERGGDHSFGAAELDMLAMKLRQNLQEYLQVDELHIPEASPGLP